MRLGAYPCQLQPGTRALAAYGTPQIRERHRHRYEFNNRYRDMLQQRGLVFSGLNLDQDLVEIVEIPGHPWFVAVQFHPEFKSYPTQPHPLFNAFIKACTENRNA
jgi:CTP synthase